MPPVDVCIALCTCNGALWVEEQVRGIAQQTLPVRELVVRDDASEDGTVERVRQAWADAGRSDSALRIFVNEARLGVARNFEAALRACSSEFIALCDQDDRWPAGRLEHLIGALQRQPGALLVHSDARMIDASGVATGRTLLQELQADASELAAIDSGQGWRVLLQRNLVTGATVVMRRALLEHALPIPQHWLHDEWLGMVAALLGGLAREPGCWTDYRRHGGNQIGARQAPLRELVARAWKAGEDWPAYQARRAEELQSWARDRAEQLTTQKLVAIAGKTAHHSVREHLPQPRRERIYPIAREWAAGGYQRYGRGIRGVLRDLLRP
jgi:hypothetical protein